MLMHRLSRTIPDDFVGLKTNQEIHAILLELGFTPKQLLKYGRSIEVLSKHAKKFVEQGIYDHEYIIYCCTDECIDLWITTDAL